ncbi:hydroxyacid dehydrogenase [Agromyces sp. NPDC056965]|uniref:hydroxyacid dehydrogenase n=1 Tax=Agromyces sp. NPDC056965 TaxID=3345983 RepID=UPI0036272525
MTDRLRAALVMETRRRDDVYPEAVLARIDALVDLRRPILTREELAADPAALSEVDVLLTGWGAPDLDAALLASAPRLQLVLHAAGSVKHIAGEAFWRSGIPVVSAAAANAEPVAEFAFAQILLGLRRTALAARTFQDERRIAAARVATGVAGSTVGLVALGEIGRRVAAMLGTTSARVIAYDPFADPDEAAATGIELTSLEDVFERSDVVSLHAPLVPATEGMVDAALLARMRFGATIVNTARGGIIDETALIRTLASRPDLTALLDVTSPEPPTADSPLYTLRNVVLTPHIAGATGADRSAMGRLVAEELARFIAGEPLRRRVDPSVIDRLA